jgi:glycosyltransferase involved in cell wall biosynthesis
VTGLVVCAHLSWDWVWQRPQHLISRLARTRRTFYVEQPVRADVSAPTVHRSDAGPVHRIRMDVPRDFGGPGLPDFSPYLEVLPELLGSAAAGSDVWIYTPLALDLAEKLGPRTLVYDVMDDLSAFADGGADMARRQQIALRRADLVLAGGRSLHRAATEVRGPAGAHLFPSGVETAHYASSRALRTERQRPAAGYVGVIDERLDLTLLTDLAAKLPEWDIHLVGPVTKIDPSTLPQASNLHYPGMQPYERLPEVMAGLDVALMPFALNDATRSISPTKTLEYLAAGLPVVSTRVPDVVADFSQVVRFADDGAAFADACRAVLDDAVDDRDARVAPLAQRHEWDTIAARIDDLLAATVAARPPLVRA